MSLKDRRSLSARTVAAAFANLRIAAAIGAPGALPQAHLGD
jgi:hypothetical protein